MLHDKDRITPNQEGFVIAHNLRGNQISGWVFQLKANDAERKVKRKDSVTMYHEILSWHKDDARSITPEKMEQMTREYIRLRGATGAKILAVPHYNKSHYHVHLLVSGVDTAGKAMRLSRSELGELKKQIQNFQIEKFPELTKSIVAHGRNWKVRTTDKEVQMVHRVKKMSTRERIRIIVLECQERATSEHNFLVLLRARNVATYMRGGKVYGVTYDEKRYRFSSLGLSESNYVLSRESFSKKRHTRSLSR